MERSQDLNGKRGGLSDNPAQSQPALASTVTDAGAPESLFDTGIPLLRVHLVYEDSSTGDRGTHLIETLAEHLKLEADFHLTATVFESIELGQNHEEDLMLPGETDILLVSAHGERTLPISVISWIQKWLRARQTTPRALVLSLDAAAQATDWANELEATFQDEARRTSVDLFSHFGELPKAEKGFSMEDIQYRAQARTALLDETLRWDKPSSHWGINE